MASQFIGLYMQVVLREPYGYRLTGMVQEVEAGTSLTLVDVTADGARQHHGATIRIDATNILELSEMKPEEKQPTYNPPPVETIAAVVPPPPASKPVFVDPAILSLGRRPTSTVESAAPRHPANTAISIEAQSAQPDIVPALFQGGDLQGSAAELDIIKTMQAMNVELPAHEPVHKHISQTQQTEYTQSEQTQKKKRARSKKTPQNKAHVLEDDSQRTEGASGTSAQSGRGKGWRQTPILQSTASFQPYSSLKRNGKGGRGVNDSGWASEDVTEGMVDFDFENNLAKFDKRTIFDQMRKEDEVEDADRLVSHNRRARPLTAGGKNLHPSENVLDVPSAAAPNADFWNSEADVGVNGAEKSGGREARGVQTVRTAENRHGGPGRSQSRKASGVASGTAGIVSGGHPLSRVNSNVRRPQSSTRSTPKPEQSHIKPAHQQAPKQRTPPGLYLIPSNHRVEAISTLQMLNLENIAANELGYTEDLMAENAGRGIAEVAVIALSDPALKVRFELAVAGSAGETSASNSTVAVLASNNKSSIRALAAARHLRNMNIHVIVCLVGIDRERDLLEDLRRQIQLYRNFGGKVLTKNDFFEHLRKGTPAGARIAVSLIVDALLGLTMSFEELRVGDQATVYELMEWANRNEAFVLSVDIPTGIDPSSGKIAIIDGGHLFVKPRYVVSIGVPKRGLLEAVTPTPEDEPGASSNPAQEDKWRLFITDLGLGSAVWRKAGTKMRRGVEFGGKWVLEMRYQGAGAETNDDEDLDV